MKKAALPHRNSISITINGAKFSLFDGTSVASALLSAEISEFRRTSRGNSPRALFCGMGSCYDCVVTVNGNVQRSCITPIDSGMSIETTGGLQK